MERIIKKGDKAISAHLDHLKNNGEKLLYQQGIQYLKDNKIDMTNLNKPKVCNHKLENIERNSDESSLSELTNFPVQMHLISPESSIFNKSDVIFAADCTAYAYKRFHSELIKNKKLIIACPKLDSRKESYIDKLSILIDNAKINTLSVVIMQVPCCNGLIKIATDAREKAERYIPIKKIVISVKGEILTDEWI